MGLMDKANNLASSVQEGVKTGSQSVFNTILKVLTSLVVGYVFAVIGEEVFKYQTLSFLFVLVVVGLIVMRFLASWKLGAVLVFDLICLLIGLVLRMYILLAP